MDLNRIDVDVDSGVGIRVLELDGVRAIAQKGGQGPTLLPGQAASILTEGSIQRAIDPDFHIPAVRILREVDCEPCPGEGDRRTRILDIGVVIGVSVRSCLSRACPSACVCPSRMRIIVDPRPYRT